MSKFFEIKNASITDEKVDAYVVPVSPYGYDGAVGLPAIMAKKANSFQGFKDLNELAKSEEFYGMGFRMGEAVLTKSYGGNSKYFMNVVTVDTDNEYDFDAYMHHVDPNDKSSQIKTIEKAIYNSINEAIKNNIKSIALPLLSTGNSPKSVSNEQSIVAILEGLYSAEKDFAENGNMPKCIVDIYDEKQMKDVVKYADMDSLAVSKKFNEFTTKNDGSKKNLFDVVQSKLSRD